MRGSILSQDEIEALLHNDRSATFQEGLFELLTKAAQGIVGRLGKLLAAEVRMEGPYIERQADSLSQSITDESYVLAADLGPNELFMFMSAADSEILAAHLGTSCENGVSAVGRAWAVELAAQSTLPYSLFKAQQIGRDFLAALPVEEDSFLVRHLLQLGAESLEFCLLIPGSRAAALVTAYKHKPTAAAAAVGRRFLQGQASPVSEAAFMPLDSAGRAGGEHGINLLEDITLTVTVELGRTDLTLNELLELKPQSIISLQRHAGDAVDVYVNDRLAAKAEVVVLEENFGVRVLEIISQSKAGRDDGR